MMIDSVEVSLKVEVIVIECCVRLIWWFFSRYYVEMFSMKVEVVI